MKDYYYMTPSTRANAPAIKALSEKVQRLERALEDEHDKPSKLIESKYTLQLEAKVRELEEIISTGWKNNPRSDTPKSAVITELSDRLERMRAVNRELSGSLQKALTDKQTDNDARVYALRERLNEAHAKMAQLRNCSNCNEKYCADAVDKALVDGCIDNGYFNWEIENAAD